MKKITLTFLLSLYFYFIGIACDPIFISFCESSTDNFATENIVSGIITQHLDDGIQMDVIQVLRGTESRTILTVWNGTDIDCNGIFSMDTFAYGAIGDTVVAIVEVIVEQQNDWEVIGDYRRPSSLWDQTYLPVREDSVYISGYDFYEQVAYSDFIEDVTCLRPNNTSPVDTNSTPIVYPNPVGDLLYFEHLKWTDFSILIYDVQGRLVERFYQQQFVNVQGLERGIYFIAVQNAFDNQFFKAKFVKD